MMCINYLASPNHHAMNTSRLYPFLCASMLFPVVGSSQCVADEVTGPVLTLSTTTLEGTNNRSGVVFNPLLGRYYSVNAGSAGYPLETYDEGGTLLDSVVSGFDYRGAWWNPALSQFEGNGFDDLGIFVQNIDPVTGYALGTGSVILDAAQPEAQSIGDLDTDADEIIYYSEGAIHRYARASNVFLGTLPITGLPVTTSNLNSNSVVYTGCPGSEIGVYDFENRRVLFINKSTGAFSSQCQLPLSAPPRNSFGMSFANGLFWLFANNQWQGYDVLDGNVGIAEEELFNVSVFPSPASDVLTVSWEGIGVPAAEVRILDMAGRMVLNKRSAADRLVLNVRGLRPGAYMVQCVSANRSFTGRFLKE